MKTNYNPHQELFNYVFGRRENAAELIRAVLPPEITHQLDLSTVSVELVTPDVQIDDRKYAYMVYSVRFRDTQDILHILVRFNE